MESGRQVVVGASTRVQKSFKNRSTGASTSDTRRIRRRSISMTPEIGDDIVRAVRAMNESLKQNRLLREQVNEGSTSYSEDKGNGEDPWKDVPCYHVDGHGHVSGPYGHSRKQGLSRELLEKLDNILA
ncbi:hypothetical protein Taro_007814 [Colocasia esculenta]|uniref:Uncharacterized protein n=1 Tax=Colocasia esculenta TaxID=4460 RepID=A0A843TS91_COLES|nr:hypothetical protein [Colocasia esculenta]